jgi:hypothetical protein
MCDTLRRRSMAQLRKAIVNGEEYWVEHLNDAISIVRGRVGTGKPREDEKEYEERSPIDALLRHWGWNRSKIERHPTGNGEAYDFDCTNEETGEQAAIEVKRIIPRRAMQDAIAGVDTKIDPAALRKLPGEFASKANRQLAAAPKAARRCALLIWVQEDAFFWDQIRAAVEELNTYAYEAVDEVWLTSAHLLRWVSVPAPASKPQEK